MITQTEETTKKTKDDVSKAAIMAWWSNWEFSGMFAQSFIKGTGTGKSKDGILIAKQIYERYKNSGTEFKPLLLVNSTNLRDNGWKAEFIKWGEEELYNLFTVECYQTVYKWRDTEWSFVLADEGDFSLTEEYSKFYINNKYDCLLLLTATVSEDKKALLDIIAPVTFRYSTQQAQQDGVLNKSVFVQVNFDLDNKDKYVEVKRGKNMFFFTEQQHYAYIEGQFRKQQILCNTLKSRSHRHELGLIVMDAKTLSTHEKELSWAEKKAQMIATQRMNLLFNLKSSRLATQQVVKRILQKSGTKVLIFSKRTEQIDKLCKYTYHSNSPDNSSVSAFNGDDTRVLGVVDAMNRGVNLVGVTHIVKESYNGSSTDFQQQHGRGTRLSPDDTMMFIAMVPYWSDGGVRTATQAETWFTKMTADFDLSGLKTIELSALS
jgi:superfamily II DNA or RNA helicase